MMTCYITITYHIISYHIFFSLLSVLLICSPLYSSQLHFISNWFDSIRLNSIRLFSIEIDLSYCSVLYHISMNDLCLFVCQSVWMFICICLFLFWWARVTLPYHMISYAISLADLITILYYFKLIQFDFILCTFFFFIASYINKWFYLK